MLSLKEFRDLYEEIRKTDLNLEDNNLNYFEQLQANMIEYLRMKVQEASMIFKKFDAQGVFEVYH